MSVYREAAVMPRKWFRTEDLAFRVSEIQYVRHNASNKEFPYETRFTDGKILNLSSGIGKLLLEFLND